MSIFNIEKEETFGSVKTRLYSYEEENNELSDYIKQKVKQPALNFKYMSENYGSDSLNNEVLLQKYEEISTPKDHVIPAFDIKSSVVTEFMAEFLLTKEFQCIFFDKANKKINKLVVNADHHSTGIDVVGIQEKNKKLKFIAISI